MRWTKEQSRTGTRVGGNASLENLNVVVTGAGSGVGLATARLFAARGARVALLGRRAAALQTIEDELAPLASGYVVDIADERAVVETIEQIYSDFGGIDVVVNAAGIAQEAALQQLDGDTWRATIDTNLSGTFYVCREAANYLPHGGAVVNVASDLATMGVAGLVHYSASKAGVVGLTRGLAAELAPRIRVNAVCPGPIDTPMLRAGIEAAADPAAALRTKELSVPLARLASADEVARAIYFLAVDGTFATGATLEFDGGTSVV
ncbi:SDR family NAD(P)-dependent oxidoreductase [Gulosibacter sp. ACHW.36C]|uniref:SDR family oxidoreductase n=1 Tax=Gulosibacter sediminis TaxID=1729695 RepID=A0ABY4MXA8_9MICO|nr:SDR family NAD(P)-dependent oxidoreductase [Gulosibacter sediminis]UQN15062.1 SDR family oxidoreductase [Gulosibacter sediminis]